MSLPSVSPELLRAGDNRFLSRFIPMLGISLSEMDYLRGWKDDFFGDALFTGYFGALNLGGGAALQSIHGGVERLSAAAAAGSYFRLWIGNPAGIGADTLDADEGWVMLVRMRISSTTNIYARVGARDNAGNNVVDVGANIGGGANWYLTTRVGGAAYQYADSGVASDTDWHWHVIDVKPITGGNRQADYFLDGTFRASSTNVAAVNLTPLAFCQAAAVAAKDLDLDFWGVIPRNLA